ncbi:hypothetical protein N7532_006784 [Penicillium argentinense]|uniref:HAD-like domain-containing protein n=1 Tax=Penicillium argentinense TaxID=1131581 RepID=A0A9W9FGK0_9EURO|nr:uncharacterized protein N7532_006784 [Penicillium argentinense]KAJ5099783.1 hypothetical protein N7532_006784 [Penicillium argentinense]
MSLSASTLPSIIASKKWFGFDLDDTLHEFRKASAQASQSVFESIHAQYGIGIDSLKSSYSQVLQTTTAGAFTDGRTSTDYRRERFTRLLQTHGINDANQDTDVESLLTIYKSSLKSSLALKAGALSFLRAIQDRGKKIIVVTEGPADAQEWTIRELGLEPLVDVAVTTNEIGKSKVEGLFSIVLYKYDINREEIIYFGDNAIRDIKASQEEGIVAVLYDEKQNNQLSDKFSLRINSWKAMQDILELES